MNNQENYKSKYLKYKTKYLNLLSQSGGSCEKGTPEENSFICLKKEFEQIINELPTHECVWENCTYYSEKLNRLYKIRDKIMNIPKLERDIKKDFVDAITKIEGTQNSCKICTLKKEVDGIISDIIPRGRDSADLKVYNTSINRINEIIKTLNPQGESTTYFNEKLNYIKNRINPSSKK